MSVRGAFHSLMERGHVNPIPTIGVGLFWCLIPCLYGARSSAQYTVVFAVLFVVAALLLFRSFSLRAVRFTMTDAFVCAYGLYGILSVLYIRDIPADPLRIYEWGGLFLLYILIRSIPHEEVRTLLLFIILSGVLQAVVGLAQLGEIIASKNTEFALTGSFLNPGPLGGYLAVSLVTTIVLCVKEFRNRGVSFWLLVLAALFIGFVCFRSDSRAAWLSVVIALSVGALWMTTQKLSGRIFRSLIWVLLPVLLLLLFKYRTDSAQARLFIWKVSADMYLDRPIFGHGAGSYESQYMLFQADYLTRHRDSSYAVSADNNFVAYNEFIHVLCDQGIIGFVLFLSVCISALFHGKTVRKEETAIRCGFVSLIVFSCFSYPASVLPLKMLFPLYVGMLSEETALLETPIRKKMFQPILSGLLVLLLSFCVVTFVHTHRAYNTLRGMLERDPEAIEQGIRDFPSFTYDVEYVLNHARILFVLHHYEESLEPLQQAAALCPSSTVYCDWGVSLQRVGQYREAERAFQKASLMTPGFITPPYKLFRLYLEIGDKPKADSMAVLILHKRLKIENARTMIIRTEVEKYVESGYSGAY